MQVKFKLIFKTQQKKDGTPYTKMLTILKLKDGTDKWCEIKFGDEVNTKLFKGENQIIVANSEDVRLPKSFEPYTDKKTGKKKYPYVWCEKIISNSKYEFKPSSEPMETTQDAFSFNDDDALPFD